MGRGWGCAVPGLSCTGSGVASIWDVVAGVGWCGGQRWSRVSMSVRIGSGLCCQLSGGDLLIIIAYHERNLV